MSWSWEVELYWSILLCSLNPENTWPPLILPCHYSPSALLKHTSGKATICVSDKSGHAHYHWEAFVTLAVEGSRADRQNQKEEMCEALECLLTADCTTQDSVSYSGRTWWSDS